MAVSSVPNSSGSINQALQQPHKSTQSQGPGQTHNATNANSTQHTQQATQAQTAQAPKPVVNGQGQKTGQVLNTTA